MITLILIYLLIGANLARYSYLDEYRVDRLDHEIMTGVVITVLYPFLYSWWLFDMYKHKLGSVFKVFYFPADMVYKRLNKPERLVEEIYK